MSFITTKIYEILLSGFRGFSLTRKTRLTDGRVKNILPYTTCYVGYMYNYMTPVGVSDQLKSKFCSLESQVSRLNSALS